MRLVRFKLLSISLASSLTSLFACALPAHSVDLYVLPSTPQVERIYLSSDADSEPLVKEGIACFKKSMLLKRSREKSEKDKADAEVTKARASFTQALVVIAKQIPGVNISRFQQFVGELVQTSDTAFQADLQQLSKDKHRAEQIAYVMKMLGDTYTSHDDYITSMSLFLKAKDIALALNESSLAAAYETVAALRTDNDGKSQRANAFFKVAVGMFGNKQEDRISKLNLAAAYTGYGDCLISKEQSRQSLENYNMALRIRREVDPENIEGVAEIEEKIGERCEIAENLTDAEQHYKKALQLRLDHLKPETLSFVVKSYKQLYMCCESGYRYSDEINLMKKAIALREKSLDGAESKAQLADLYARLGHAYAEMREYDMAVKEYEIAIASGKDFDNDDVALFGVLREIAVCYEADGQEDKALAAYQNNLNITRTKSDYAQLEVHHLAIDDMVRFLINSGKTSDADPEVDKELKIRLDELGSRQKDEDAERAKAREEAAPSWWRENESTLYVVGSLALFLFAALGGIIWYVTKTSKPPSI